MKNKAIIFDIDGTAINSPQQKIPTQRLIDAIRGAESSYYICAATGRVWSFAEPILRAMKLVDPCVISSGTQICDPSNGKILWQSNLETVDLEEALRIIKQYPNYMAVYNEYTEDDYLYGGTPPTELKIDGPVYILEQKFVPQRVAPEIVARLTAIEGIACTLVVAQRPGFNDIHITNRNATKEHAVDKLLTILKVDKEDTIGIGDGHNDIHLFNAVRHRVAMENSVEELKVAADEVIGNVVNDGFAAFLEKLAHKANV